MDESREKFMRVAQSIKEVWNKLSKEHGWPHRKTEESLLREGKAIRSTIRYWATSKNDLETKKGVEWVLRRWNWNKNPAPLNLLASKTQWAGYQMVMNRVEEENQSAMEEKMESLLTWAEKEMERNIKKGMTSSESKKNIQELSKILGKTASLTDKEKELFFNFCDKLELARKE
jgi:hypothetical protein